MSRARPPLPLPDPPLCDGEVVLRPWAATDAPDLAAAWADPEVIRWTGVPARSDETAAALWIAGESDRRARGLALDLALEVGGALAGEIGLVPVDLQLRTAEIGWWIGPCHRGSGLAGRATRLFVRWALSELCVDAVVARCRPENPASGAVARAAGFTSAGTSGGFDVWRCC